MATIKEIAKKANVSVATVSYVINETRYVSPKLKERVLNAIEELNYVPNAMARGLRAKSTKTFGLVLTDITNPFYPDLARGCEDKAKSLGYYVMMINTDEKEDVLLNAIKQLREGRLDGLIVASATKSHRKILKEVIDEGYPIVLAHRYLDNLNVDTVVEDNETGMTAAVRYLLSLGHREIHLMSGKDDSFVSKARKSYFFKAMEEAGI